MSTLNFVYDNLNRSGRSPISRTSLNLSRSRNPGDHPALLAYGPRTRLFASDNYLRRDTSTPTNPSEVEGGESVNFRSSALIIYGRENDYGDRVDRFYGSAVPRDIFEAS